MIAEGLVMLNGEVLASPAVNVTPADRNCSEPYLFTFVELLRSRRVSACRMAVRSPRMHSTSSRPDREQCRAAAPPGE